MIWSGGIDLTRILIEGNIFQYTKLGVNNLFWIFLEIMNA